MCFFFWSWNIRFCSMLRKLKKKNESYQVSMLCSNFSKFIQHSTDLNRFVFFVPVSGYLKVVLNVAPKGGNLCSFQDLDQFILFQFWEYSWMSRRISSYALKFFWKRKSKGDDALHCKIQLTFLRLTKQSKKLAVNVASIWHRMPSKKLWWGWSVRDDCVHCDRLDIIIFCASFCLSSKLWKWWSNVAIRSNERSKLRWYFLNV